MRGSPLIRTLLVILGLLAAAAGVSVLTKSRTPRPTQVQASEAGPERSLTEIPFELTLSAPAREVILESALVQVSPEIDGPVLRGILFAEGDHSPIFITIHWAEGDDTPKFAKLRLEPPGLPTLTRTFDAIGDLEDVWEPHLH